MTRWAIIGALVAATTASASLAEDAQKNATPVCMSGGVQYKAGDYACLPACHGRRRLARCEVNGSGGQALWSYVSDACPSAMIDNPPWPSDWSELPVATDMTPLPLTVNLSAVAPQFAPRIGSHWRALIR